MCKITVTEWQQIGLIFDKQANIIAAWVFGSAQDGTIKPGSDLDLAILFDVVPTLDELSELRADLQQALQIDNIDLVALNRASPILRFEAISGQAVFCRDRGRRAEFASLTAREYEDAMALARRGLAISEPEP